MRRGLSQCIFQPLRCLVLSLGGGIETTRVHQSCRRCSGMAAECARATGRADAAYRRTRGPCRGQPEGQAQVAAFVQTLQSLGWTTGRNVQIDIRWNVTDAASSRRYAAEMVALAPDVIVTSASAATAAVQEATRTLPIVFVNVSDPVGAG